MRCSRRRLYDPELDVLYFGSHDGKRSTRVAAEDGHMIFRYDAAAEITQRPTISGETLLFTSAADFLFAIDRRTGKEKWKVHRTSALGIELPAGYASGRPSPKHGVHRLFRWSRRRV